MSVQTQNQKWYDKPGFIVIVEFFYLIILFTIGLVYLTDLRRLMPIMPDSFGPISSGVIWFGALGGIIISLAGTVEHRKDWDPSMKYWHLTRPFVGAAMAIISVLIFQAGVLSVATPSQNSGTTDNLLYYLIAFLVGYREETFRQLIKRLVDVVLTPGESAPPPVVTGLDPSQGGIAGGDKVTIMGNGFTGTTNVKFGSTPAMIFSIDSDTRITATTPQAVKAGIVSVTVTSKGGSGTGGGFTYV